MAICHLVTRGFGGAKGKHWGTPGELNEGEADRHPAQDPGGPRTGVGMATRRAVPAGTSFVMGRGGFKTSIGL